jgi:hypothetical protein
VVPPPNHEMIVNVDPQGFGGGHDLPRHLDIGARRRRIAARVIVHKDDGRGGELQRSLDDLARVNRRVINRSVALDFISDERVFPIEKQYAEFLVDAARHGGRAIVQ